MSSSNKINSMCCGFNIIDHDVIRRNKISNTDNLCYEHKHKYRFEKGDCPICLEPIELPEIQSLKQLQPLSCGHWVHRECIRKCKPECPLCRTPIAPKEIKYFMNCRNVEHFSKYMQCTYLNAIRMQDELMILRVEIILGIIEKMNEHEKRTVQKQIEMKCRTVTEVEMYIREYIKTRNIQSSSVRIFFSLFNC